MNARQAQYTFLPPLAMLACLSVAGRVGADDAADALAQRFLAHMARNRPIAGQFEIHTVQSPQARAKAVKQAEAMSGGRLRVSPGQPDQTLICRWAWDQEREVLDTLTGSRDQFASLYRDKEATLVGYAKGRFNLDKAADVPIWRPASFYFLCSQLPWPALFGECDFSSPGPVAGGDPELATFVARKRKDKMVVRFTVFKDSCALKAADVEFNARRVIELRVAALARGPDHRVFPSSATLAMFSPDEANTPLRHMALTARAVEFPQPAAAAAALQLHLPKGTVIADRLLNTQADLGAPATAAEIIAGKVKWASQPVTPPAPLQPDSSASGTTRWPLIGVVAFAAGAAVIFALKRLTRVPDEDGGKPIA